MEQNKTKMNKEYMEELLFALERKIPRDCKRLIRALGKETYVVGGCVRDVILNKNPHDWDITTKLTPQEIKNRLSGIEEYSINPLGEKYGTLVITTEEGNNYEVTTFRGDGNYSDNRHPDKVEFKKYLIEDLHRRDFTMNAIAFRPNFSAIGNSAVIVDPNDGIEDLNNKLIRAVGNPNIRFEEDALRVMRCIRFSAQLGFEIEYSTGVALYKGAEGLKNVSKERIRDEFNKILLSNSTIHIENALNVLHYSAAGLYKAISPHLANMVGVNQRNPYHSYDLWEHSTIAMCCVKEPSYYTIQDDDVPGEQLLALRLAMLWHDTGKPDTCKLGDDNYYHYKNHAVRSEEIAREDLTRLKYSKKMINLVCCLIKYHDFVFAEDNKTITKQLKRLINKIGINRTQDLIEVRMADILAQNPRYIPERLTKINRVKSLLHEIFENSECVSIKDLKITGNDIMEEFNLKPCKKVGDLLKIALDLVIDRGEEYNDKTTLLLYIKPIVNLSDEAMKEVLNKMEERIKE